MTGPAGKIRRILSSAAVIIALAHGSVSQDASPGRFTTFRQLLRERNISLSEDGLSAALHNTDPHIRYLAALVLAEDKASRAVPLIAASIAIESVPEAKVNMSLALAQLGDERGLAFLRKDCSDPSLAPTLRMYAAKYLLDLHSEGCLASIESVLHSATDAGSKVLALSQLARSRYAAGTNTEEIVGAMAGALTDRESTVRVAASHGLVALGVPSGLPYLEGAASAERNESVRSIMQSDLRMLQGNAAR
jgi:HEAT repeat protein